MSRKKMLSGWPLTKPHVFSAAARGSAQCWAASTVIGERLQLVDDLLDFTASAEQLGKPVLSDLKEGKVTLPLIYAMENGHRDARELVARVLEEKEFISVRP